MKTVALALMLVVGCGSPPPPIRSAVERTGDSAPAISALRASQFELAEREASTALARDPRNAQAAAVRAIVRYLAAGEHLVSTLEQLTAHADSMHFLDHESGRTMWRTFADRLAVIDQDLAVVAADREFSLELCLACWEHDWNRSGQVDARDRKLLEIEIDGEGGELPPGDPRRRPTFRFDVGDALWARAMIAFQRSAVDLVLAYRWSELDKLFGSGEEAPRVTLHLVDPGRVRHARELIVAGLGFADRCRTEYLDETDDDREWVPSPRQHSHPVPLDVDTQLFATWAAITGDVRRLLTSEEAISLREAAELVVPMGAHFMPDAEIDLGRMLREPTDIVIDLSNKQPTPKNIERILRELLGHGYATGLRASPLVERLRHMKRELDRGEDTAWQKLHYLLWLN